MPSIGVAGSKRGKGNWSAPFPEAEMWKTEYFLSGLLDAEEDDCSGRCAN